MLGRTGVAVGAGLAAALLFIVAAKGTALATLLAFFALLPLMIASLGFGHLSGLVGAAAGALAVGLAMRWIHALEFLVGVGLPAWALAYAALLARPARDGSALHWFPLGRILALAAALAALLGLVGIGLDAWRSGGLDASQTRLASQLTPLVERLMSATGRTLDSSESAALARLVAKALPMFVTWFRLLMFAINLWAAARIVEASHRLARPWQAAPEHLFAPRGLLIAFGLGVLVSFLGGAVGLVGGVSAAAAGAAFGLTGLATVHARTRGKSQRGPTLFAVYLSLALLSPWSFFAFVLIGLADAIFGLRGQGGFLPVSSTNPKE